MAPALLVALWCATATTAAAARYGDYSGARMPQYGGPDYDGSAARAHDPEDYRGHSPDAPAALDYKYEEELAGALSGKTELPVKEEKKEAEETEEPKWQRPLKRSKKKKSGRAADEYLPSIDRFDPEDDFPNAKTGTRHFTKHRPRLKSRKHEINDDDVHGYPVSRQQNDRYSREDDELRDKEVFQNEKRNSRGERKVRRKPRDKIDRESDRGIDRLSERLTDREDLFGKGGLRSLGADDLKFGKDDMNPFGRDDRLFGRQDRPSDKDEPRFSDKADSEQVESDVDRWRLMRGGLGRAPGPPATFSDAEPDPLQRPDFPIREPPPDDEEIPRATKRVRTKGKKTKSYDDYNDYYDMKRVMSNIKNKMPTLMLRTTVREELSPPASVPAFSPPRDLLLSEPSHSLQDLLSNRRVFLPPPPATRTTLVQQVIPLSSTITTTTGTTTTVERTTNAAKTKNGTELSLAEKSRLSILKKAQRKESLDAGLKTKKPPVLLQVTKKMPTVVMVEPPSSEPFMRAREVYADSPSRLDQVKRLMRHKLVANAKNIHDLTDNWDDLVCDYIDMSLLDSISSADAISGTVIKLLPLIMIVW